MIELHGVRVHFPLRQGLFEAFRGRPRGAVRAVDGVDLRVGASEVVALVGESGCGKTTTGRALVRLAPITAGRVVLDGEDVTNLGGAALRAYRRRVQIIFQDPYESLNPKQTVHDIVAEPLEVHGLARGAEREEGGAPPTSCRAASASASRSPRPWSWSPPSWWPTSRSACSTSRSGPASSR